MLPYIPHIYFKKKEAFCSITILLYIKGYSEPYVKLHCPCDGTTNLYLFCHSVEVHPIFCYCSEKVGNFAWLCVYVCYGQIDFYFIWSRFSVHIAYHTYESRGNGVSPDSQPVVNSYRSKHSAVSSRTLQRTGWGQFLTQHCTVIVRFL